MATRLGCAACIQHPWHLCFTLPAGAEKRMRRKRKKKRLAELLAYFLRCIHSYLILHHSIPYICTTLFHLCHALFSLWHHSTSHHIIHLHTSLSIPLFSSPFINQNSFLPLQSYNGYIQVQRCHAIWQQARSRLGCDCSRSTSLVRH